MDHSMGFFKMVHSIEIFLLGSFQDFFKPWFHLQFFFTWPLQVFLQSILSGFFKSGQLHTYFYNFDCWIL